MKRYAMQNRDGHVFSLAKDEEVPAGCQLVAVIPPEDREQVERLLATYHGWKWDDRIIDSKGASVADMQAALREFANPKPPRMEEPLGKHERVRDREGDEWARVGGSWVCEHGGVPRDWDYLVNECGPLEVS